MTKDEMNRDANKAADEVQGRLEAAPTEEKIADHSEVFDDMAEYEAADELIDDSRKAAKRRAWMWIAVAVALVLGAAICVLMLPEITGTKDSAPAATEVTTDDGAATPAEEVEVVEETVVGIQGDTATLAPETAPAAATKATQADANTTADAGLSQATIEDEARRVIHGDFGNGDQRKEALGSHYAAVQRRVNELMHA